MIKISSIINALIAIILLGIIIAMLFFGYRFYSSSGEIDNLSVSDQLANSVALEAKSVVESIPEPAPVVALKPAPEPAPKKQFVSLYANTNAEQNAFTSLEKDSGIVVYNAGPEWTEVISAKGVPVWIRGDLVKNVGNGYVEVIIPRVNTRSAPNTESSQVIGSLAQGEVLKISRKQDGWVRVWSPIRFRAWAKTEDL